MGLIGPASPELNSVFAWKGGTYADVLRAAPRQERDQEPQEHRHEEQETGNSGRLPDLWHQGISNRQELGLPSDS